MEPRCTCGAVLPPDARFCHKCGKPQFEEDVLRLAELDAATVSTPIPAATLPLAAISFRNMRAVGISIGVAAATFLCMIAAAFVLPGVAALASPLLLAASGFFAAMIYGRQSPQPLSGAGGARLGWMTGLWFFIAFVLIAGTTVMALSSPMGADMMKQIQSQPRFSQMKFPSPNELAATVLRGTVQTFFLAVLFPIFGGIIGARFASKNRPSA